MVYFLHNFLKQKFLYKNNELNNIEALSLNILNNVENIKINDDVFSIKDKNINIENIELSRFFNYIFQENMFNEKSNVFEKIDKKFRNTFFRNERYCHKTIIYFFL